MKRIFSVVILMVFCFSFLVACHGQDNFDICSYCGTELSENTKYCSQCGESVPVEKQNQSEYNITVDQEKQVKQAIDLLIEKWRVISDNDTNNDGHLEIKNTRIIYVESDEIASTLEVDDVESIVEFIIFTDYYGAAPYYYETSYLNNVVFFADGTSIIATNVVNLYQSRTYDSALEMCTYRVVDCGDYFNQVFYLKDKAINLEDGTKSTENESSDNTVPSIYHSDDYSILDSGRCNDNISWEIRSNGVLHIFGNGAIPSYKSREVDGEIAPWRASALAYEITDVLIGNEISGLGENLFYGLSLNSLYLGKNVRVFDHNFKYFYAKNIYIPKGFKDIYFLLCEASAEKNRSEAYPITVYYEGTEEDWAEQKQKVASWRNSEDFQDVTVCFNFNYSD